VADRHARADLAAILRDAVDGRFPPPDGGFTVVPPDATTGLEAVLAFTAHAVVATACSYDEVAAIGVDGYEGGHAPDTLRALAGPHGWIGVLDVVLVAPGTGRGLGSFEETDTWDEHPRVHYARATRAGVRVIADDTGLVTLGRGLAGRTELGFEAFDPDGGGAGVNLVMAGRGAVPPSETVYASCAPGNARSLRVLLATGFVPIGGEVLIRPDRPA
jgi:hypothetical protein